MSERIEKLEKALSQSEKKPQNFREIRKPKSKKEKEKTFRSGSGSEQSRSTQALNQQELRPLNSARITKISNRSNEHTSENGTKRENPSRKRI